MLLLRRPKRDVLLLLAALLLPIVLSHGYVAAEAEDTASVFLANGGQHDEAVSFGAALPDGLRVELRDDGARIASESRSVSGDRAAVAMRFEGAVDGGLEGREQLASDGIVWFSGAMDAPLLGVPVHRAVVHEGLYPGVDLRYELLEQGLVRVLRLAPEARVDAIRLAYDALGEAQVRPDGQLKIGALRESVEAWSTAGGAETVPVAFFDRGDGTFGLRLDPAHAGQALELRLTLHLEDVLPPTAQMPSAPRLADHPLLLERLTGAEEGDLIFFATGRVPADAPSAAVSSEVAATDQAGGPISGGDFNCRALILADGDVLDPTLPFEQLLRFEVPAGATVTVLEGTDEALRVEADYVDVAGTLDARGAGFAGGAIAPQTGGSFDTIPGNAGSGPGGGGGGGSGGFFDEAAGGGGGGYGGDGGRGGFGDDGGSPGAGGPSYGMALPPGIQLGSGGGSGTSNDRGPGPEGGAGGGAVVVNAGEITIDGVLDARGAQPGGTDAGASGGGSGGGVYLDAARTATGTGAIRANGGSGSAGGSFGGGGGGGGGGRVKFVGALDPGAPWTLSAAGAGGGGSFFGTGGQPGQPGTIDSTFTSAPDPDGPLPVGCLADLSINIDVLGSGDSSPAPPPATVWAGEELVYRVGVFNSGPRLAAETMVNVTLPVGVAYLGDTDSCLVTGAGPGGEEILACDLGDLERFDSEEFLIKTRVDSGAVRDTDNGTRSIVTRASVTSLTPDPNPENNVDETRGFVQEQADLKITKIVEPHTGVQAGEQFTYTILVDNLGPSAARNIVVTDTLVASGFVRANGCSLAIRTDGGLIDEFDCNFALSTGVFDLATFGANWLMPRSPTDMGRMIITINLTAEQALDLTNTTTVTADTPDPDTGNNMAMAPLEVAGTADLSLAAPCIDTAGNVIDINNPVSAGDQMTCFFDSTNLGPSTAQDAQISASIPEIFDILAVDGMTVGGGPAGCVAGTAGDPNDRATCSYGNLAAGATANMRVELRAKPDAVTDPVTDRRQAQIDVRTVSTTFDPNLSNNLGIERVEIAAEADLNLDKFAIGAAVAGEAFHYELQVDNLGPSVARDVTLRDFLPDGVRFLEAYVDVEGGTGGVPLACEVLVGSNVVWCPLGDIAPTDGVPVYVFYNVMIDADVPAGTALTNNADVLQSDTPDPDLTNNSDDATINVQSLAELEIEKTAARLDPVSGTRLRYTLRVFNQGPADAVNVQVDDTLPAGYTFVQDSDVCTEVAPGLLACRPAGTAPDWVLPAGQGVEFDILVELDQDIAAGTDATNEACVTADNAAAPPACATADTTAERVADLRIRKFGKPDRAVQAGELLTYTVFVDNLGPSFTGPVFVTEELVSDGAFYLTALDPEILNTAPGVTYDDTQIACDYLAQDPADNSITLFQGTVRGDGLGALAAPIGPIPGHLRLTCRFEDPAGLPVFDPIDGTGRWAYRYVVRADEELDLNNLASVTGADPDPDFSNNQADTAHAYDAVADLAITKDDVGIVQGTGCPAAAAPMPAMRGMVTAGKTIQWTVNITNTGPSTAENVKFLDRLPPWVRVTDYTVNGVTGNCTTGEAGNVLDQLRCGIGTLRPGESATAVITADVDPSTREGFILENDIMVMSDTRDDNNANDFDSTLTTVKTAADLRVEKMDMPDPVKAGHELRYRVRITNDGPSDAQFVVLTDTLPAELEFVSAEITKLSKVPGMCMASKGVVNCALGALPAGHFADVEIVTTVKPDAVPAGQVQTTINNTAVVGSMTEDPCAANNTAVEPTTVQRLSAVYVVKTDDPDPVIAGEVLTYTVTFGNRGPSTATNVSVVDVLPAGLTFLGCAPNTPTDLVTCTESPAGTITLNEILAAGAVVWQDAPPPSALNDLDPGESYSFQIRALVDAGYVLDGRGDSGPGQACEALSTATGYPHFAHNNVTISADIFDMLAGAPAVQTHAHDECTRVDAAADLKIEKTDLFGDPAANPDTYFLQCDPVEPGGMITYVLTVSNDGPSDAAQVVVMDWLPEAFVAVDPAQVEIVIDGGAGVVEEVRDTGKITLVIGNDDGLLGRLNAGNSVKITIRVMVRQDAPCGGTALNTAMVTTRAVVGPPAITSPTADPNPANNADSEQTTIECPKVTVKKTVSYDGTCPGVDFATINQIGPGATYCYEITNSGTTYLDHIRITDTLRARTNGMPVIAFTDTIRHGLDPKVPVAPGETVRRQHTVGALNKECGRVTNEVIVTANPVNSGRTDLPCLELVTASDDALIEVPCAGVDWRLQLPTLDTEVCDSWVQVQNVGDNDTMVLLVAWGDAGFCPPQAAGPLKAECSGLLRPGSAWSFTASQIPTGAKSAVLYSLSAERVRTEAGGRLPFGRTVCEEFFFGVVGDDFAWAEFDSAYRERYPWRGLDFSTYHGEPIAASVNRSCPDPEDPNLTVNAAYTGISSDLEGARDPRSGSFAFFAPLVFAGQNGMNSQIHIQNSGTECTSLELWMKAQDNCMRPTLADVLSLAPGETVTFDPNTVVGPDWLGSAWVRSTQPLGLVVDTLAGNHFTSYNGFAADIHDYGFSVGNMISYVPLIYSEYQGWDTAIQVQNLSAITAAKVKVYFLDRSGDVITTLVDWVCPYGSQTFFLPVLSALPGNWVGSARVESQEWWAPGQPLVEPPRIASVALMEKWADPARTSRREAVAYNGSPECLLYDWQIADGTKGGLSSGSAVFAIPLVAKGNRGITSEIGITNLVPKPGFTDFAMFFYDQNGLLDHVCQKLNEKQVEYINLDSWGFVHNGFLGSMVVSAVFWEHDVFDSRGRFQRNLVGLGGVAVERIGGVLGGQDVPGDESKAFEAFPVFDHFAPEDPPNCPGVPGGFRP